MPGARERFAQKMLGTSPASEATGHLVFTAGTRVPVEVSSVQLRSGETVVGVFGLIEERPDDTPRTPPPHLTPVKPKYFVFWSRAARRSRSLPNST